MNKIDTMNEVIKKIKSKVILTATILILVIGCDFWDDFNRELSHISNNIEFEEKLSSYGLFKGEIYRLIPARGVELFKLSTSLFTDYAKKQRLIKLPEGTSMRAQGDGLPSFPDGTIIAKTFYYLKDAADSKGKKRILETRLLIKKNEQWNVGVYEWNAQQNEAYFIKDGSDKEVQWITEEGQARKIYYHIPSQSECTTCHQLSGEIVPIGPKLRNLNVSNNASHEGIHQLEHWEKIGWLELDDLSKVGKLPDWENKSYSLHERARAYLDVNCAHCHNPGGFASHKRLNLAYEAPFAQTDMARKKHHIPARMESGWADEKMPKIGTTIIHKEGLELIKKYVESL